MYKSKIVAIEMKVYLSGPISKDPISAPIYDLYKPDYTPSENV